MLISSSLNRRTTTLLDRLARLGATLARERRSTKSNGIRLMRLNAMVLNLKRQLRLLSEERALRAASAPRLVPALVQARLR